MKTNIFIVFLFMCFCCISCSEDVKNDVKSDAERQMTYAKLNNDLSSYSQSFMATHTVTPATRGFGRWWKSVLFCDAAGALIGSVGGGAGALLGAVLFSALGGSCAYVVPNNPQSEMVHNPRVELNEYSTLNCIDLDSIGYLHNVILSEISEENEGVFEQNLSVGEWSDLVLSKMEKYGYYVFPIDKSRIVNDATVMQPTNDIIQSESATIAYFQKMKPELSNELDIINNYTFNANMITDDAELSEYTEGYLHILSRADLPKKDLDVMSSSIIVAGNSAVLWKDNTLKIDTVENLFIYL